MFDIQMLLEKHRVNNASYAATEAAPYSAPLDDPDNFDSDYYTFTYPGDAANATTYTITATATGSQISDAGCTSMTLNQASVKTPTSGCWKK